MAVTRRWDGEPGTAAETRFFDLRGSGYRGPVDQDGYVDDPDGWLQTHLSSGTPLLAQAVVGWAGRHGLGVRASGRGHEMTVLDAFAAFSDETRPLASRLLVEVAKTLGDALELVAEHDLDVIDIFGWMDGWAARGEAPAQTFADAVGISAYLNSESRARWSNKSRLWH